VAAEIVEAHLPKNIKASIGASSHITPNPVWERVTSEEHHSIKPTTLIVDYYRHFFAMVET
jgi:hypothetical protein